MPAVELRSGMGEVPVSPVSRKVVPALSGMEPMSLRVPAGKAVSVR